MPRVDEIWQDHRDRSEQALLEARFLLDAGHFDGARIRALGSCIQIARAVTIRLRRDRDPDDLIPAVRKMAEDGRIPETLYGPLCKLKSAYHQQTELSLPIGDKDARVAVEIAENLYRAFLSASDLTVSRNSPQVKRAAAAKGIPVPTGW